MQLTDVPWERSLFDVFLLGVARASLLAILLSNLGWSTTNPHPPPSPPLPSPLTPHTLTPPPQNLLHGCV